MAKIACSVIHIEAAGPEKASIDLVIRSEPFQEQGLSAIVGAAKNGYWESISYRTEIYNGRIEYNRDTNKASVWKAGQRGIFFEGVLRGNEGGRVECKLRYV